MSVYIPPLIESVSEQTPELQEPEQEKKESRLGRDYSLYLKTCERKEVSLLLRRGHSWGNCCITHGIEWFLSEFAEFGKGCVAILHDAGYDFRPCPLPVLVDYHLGHPTDVIRGWSIEKYEKFCKKFDKLLEIGNPGAYYPTCTRCNKTPIHFVWAYRKLGTMMKAPSGVQALSWNLIDMVRGTDRDEDGYHGLSDPDTVRVIAACHRKIEALGISVSDILYKLCREDGVLDIRTVELWVEDAWKKFGVTKREVKAKEAVDLLQDVAYMAGLEVGQYVTEKVRPRYGADRDVITDGGATLGEIAVFREAKPRKGKKKGTR
jgi:hypothetical protein